MRLVVENLSRSVTHADLNDLGLAYGKVTSATVATTLSDGKSKGFGFLEFSDADAARAAIAALDGRDLQGQVLRVRDVSSRSVRF